MSTIDIHLRDELKTFLDQEVARRGYKTASEFVEDLLDAERRRNQRDELEQMLLEAIDGPFSDWTDEDVEDIQRVGDRILQQRKKR